MKEGPRRKLRYYQLIHPEMETDLLFASRMTEDELKVRPHTLLIEAGTPLTPDGELDIMNPNDFLLKEIGSPRTWPVVKAISYENVGHSWTHAREHTHDASGIIDPEEHEWYLFNGIYYPIV